MITVAIVGILAALAIYGVRRYVFSARTVEARNSVGRMAKDAAASYLREIMAGENLALGGTAQNANRLCVSASATVPSAAGAIKGKKYQSSPTEWEVDKATPGKGFACIRFSMTDPQFYQYDYQTSTNDWTTSGAVGTSFDAIARGDLDGDGTLSEFKMTGTLQATSSGAAALTLAPTLSESDALD